MKFLADKGVKHVFYLPGGGAMYLVDALGRNPDLTGIRCLHEQVAGIAADMYAQIAGLGVCLVTSGPGATNAITACAGAWADSCPTIFISGQVRRDQLIGSTCLRMHGIQEADIIPMVTPVTKYAARVMFPDQIQMHLDRAIFSATTGRKGPVWLDIPQDVQAAEVGDDLTAGMYYAPRLPVTHLKELTADLLKARRPVIMVGAGILPHDAEFRYLARKLNVPVLTTARMYGLFNQDDPLWFGRPGNPAHRYASKILQNADFILSIGARMGWWYTGYNLKDFAPYAKWYAVDIDPAELSKHERTIKINCDAGDFIQTMLKIPPQLTNYFDWWDDCNAWKENYIVPYINHDPRIFSHNLALASKPDDVIVPCSSGLDIEGVYQGWVSREGQYLHFMPDFGSIGFGLSSSIGACLASGGKHTICIEGDGGYLLNQSAWETIKEYSLPIDYYIMANGIYGSIQATEDNYFEGRRMGSALPIIIPDGPTMHIVPIDPAFRPERPGVKMIDGLPQGTTIEETYTWQDPPATRQN